MSQRRARVGFLLGALLLLAGCATNNGPTKYTAQVKTNYLETCKEGVGDKLGGASQATDYCECSYDKIAGEVPFSDFKDYEDYLRAHVGDTIKTASDLHTKYPKIFDLMNTCVPTGPNAPATTAGGAATTVTTTVTTTR